MPEETEDQEEEMPEEPIPPKSRLLIDAKGFVGKLWTSFLKKKKKKKKKKR